MRVANLSYTSLPNRLLSINPYQHQINGNKPPLLRRLVLPPQCKVSALRTQELYQRSIQLVTGYAQTILYTIFIRAGDPKPQPGSPRFIRDRKRIHVAVILIYLLYTVYEADWQLRRAGDFYSLLGVAHDAGEKGINSKFRRLYVAILTS